MSQPLRIALVGCNHMGLRHLAGYALLEESWAGPVEVAAVCDLDAGRARQAADRAEELLGLRPAVHTSLEETLADPGVDAIDLVTTPHTHHTLAAAALRAGKHVLVEKPIGITVAAARQVLDAAKESDAVLAVAENYRRDPVIRLAKAVLDAGLIGRVHLMSLQQIGGTDQVTVTRWRHLKDRGAIGLDQGVHWTDVFQYLLGDLTTASGHGFVAEPVRHSEEGPDLTATGEDSLLALFGTASGAHAQLAYIPSGPGHIYQQQSLHGTLGSLALPRDRFGSPPPVLRTAEGTWTGTEILSLLPGFALDPATAALFGKDGVAYDLPFPRVDASLIALELADFAHAVREGREAEVDGQAGLTAVAGILALYESDRLGRTVTLQEVLDGSVSGYQDEIDEKLGVRR